jgi:hypothetical protein
MALMSAGPKYHGWTHRPASEGGTDPIPGLGASDLSWALGSQAEVATAKTSSWYYAQFSSIGTNDTSAFELADVSGTSSQYVQINEEGYYVGWAAILALSAGAWGANLTVVQPIAEIGGSPSPMESSFDPYSDSFSTLFSRNDEKTATEEGHRSLWVPFSFNYDKDSTASDMDQEDPLKIGIRVQSNQTGSVSFAADLFIMRIAATAGYTVTDLAA